MGTSLEIVPLQNDFHPPPPLQHLSTATAQHCRRAQHNTKLHWFTIQVQIGIIPRSLNIRLHRGIILCCYTFTTGLFARSARDKFAMIIEKTSNTSACQRTRHHGRDPTSSSESTTMLSLRYRNWRNGTMADTSASNERLIVITRPEKYSRRAAAPVTYASGVKEPLRPVTETSASWARLGEGLGYAWSPPISKLACQ